MKQPILLVAAFFIATCAFVSCDQKKVDDTPAEPDNRQAMKDRFTALNECFNTGNTAAIDTLLSTDAVDHSEDTSMHLPQGAEGLKQLVKMMRESSPDMRSEIRMMTAEGDLLMAYGTMSGTNSGSMMGMPATNKKYSYDFVDIIKFDKDMKMKEHWGVYDGLKMMTDLGMMGGPPQPDTKAKKSK
jgi:steroid delta-isomerase-like uncharacterized protein